MTIIQSRHAASLALLLSVAPTAAWSQVRLQIELGLPVAPPLVVIQPGLQVVEGFQEEVFFHQGWYWCRRPDGWYRARSPRVRFAWVEGRRVPRLLIQVPEGRYRNWHREGRPGERRELERRDGHRDERREGHRDERRDERHDERRDDRGKDRRGEREERDRH